MESPQRPSSSLFDVFLRLRPSTSTNPRFLTVEESDHDHPTHITIQPPTNANDKRKRAVERFAFTRVFEEEAQQLHLFKGTGIVRMIENVMGAPGHHGRDGLFATLGCSGSGKVCLIVWDTIGQHTNKLEEPHYPRHKDPARPCPDVARYYISSLRRATHTVFIWSPGLFFHRGSRCFRIANVYRDRILGQHVWRQPV